MNHEEFWNSTLRQVDERTKAYLKLKQRETEEKYFHSAFVLAHQYNWQRGKNKALSADDFFDVEAYRKNSNERLTKVKQHKGRKVVPRAEQQKTLAELKQSLEG
jgi:hypothetical protein